MPLLLLPLSLPQYSAAHDGISKRLIISDSRVYNMSAKALLLTNLRLLNPATQLAIHCLLVTTITIIIITGLAEAERGLQTSSDISYTRC
jgi:hypothetical protein